jgi:hypothetical protein
MNLQVHCLMRQSGFVLAGFALAWVCFVLSVGRICHQVVAGFANCPDCQRAHLSAAEFVDCFAHYSLIHRKGSNQSAAVEAAVCFVQAHQKTPRTAVAGSVVYFDQDFQIVKKSQPACFGFVAAYFALRIVPNCQKDSSTPAAGCYFAGYSGLVSQIDWLVYSVVRQIIHRPADQCSAQIMTCLKSDLSWMRRGLWRMENDGLLPLPRDAKVKDRRERVDGCKRMRTIIRKKA